MTPSIRCPFRRRSIPRHHPFWPPNSNQIDSGIRTIYDLSKGIALFGVFVPLVTFNGVWYKLVLAVSGAVLISPELSSFQLKCPHLGWASQNRTADSKCPVLPP